MTRSSSCNALTTSGWLAECEPAFAEAVLERCGFSTFDRGSAISHVGSYTDELRGVADGALTIAIAQPEAPEQKLYVARRGWWFGEYSLFCEKPKLLAVRARTAGTLAHLPKAAIDEIVGLNPRYWRYFVRLAAQHYAGMVGMVAALFANEPRVRIAARLLQMDDGNELQITQEELAEMTGFSRPTLNRVLAELEAVHAVAVGYGRVRVIDRLRLQQAAAAEVDLG